ncbi:heavy metal translocating P-type ATPase [Bacillus sp. 165]|uniref:heavy metal translocating P-type ATPase n=1 Tax=Bacillus sp. 165 TaxID=1529117 RepID=UPI001AD959A0|nr:heavy metal translocating P-type ATPase [Bacillus sp. 165]MBO9128818.1 cadmium-translocating P-type ATPase [Bacillus sp. 165]
MAEKINKQELILEGLDCGSCAAKIERGVKEIDGVASCSVNFATQTLVIEAEKEEVFSNAKQLINKLEPDIHIKEKHTKQTVQKFVLKGLDCANCAAKIDAQVKHIPDITESSLDFVSKTLTIKVNTPSQWEHITTQIKNTVHRLEPDVEVILMEKHKQYSEHTHEHGVKETKKTIWKLSIGGILTAVAALTAVPHSFEIALFIIAYLIVGGDVVLRALKNITRGQIFDENFLMAIATLGAFAIQEFPEAVAVMLFYQIGELFQGIAVNRSRKSISALMDIRPDYANLKIGNETKQIAPENINIGDIIIVKPGEKVPLDGKVIVGSSMVDTSALTGESIPREIGPGADILSGFINKNGVLTVEVTKEFGESTVSKILDLVQNASSRKAPTENFITKFARYYTPVVVITAAALAFLPPLFIEGATFADWIYRALVFLVISCPCALVVSIPLGFFGGIGGASKNGILVKGSNYLEALNNVRYVVFDKTGTLTKGVFEVTDIQPIGDISKEELLTYAAFAEVHSNHPIAQSIRKAYGKKIITDEITSYNEISGYGIEVVVEGKEILAGNAKLMNKEQIMFEQPDVIGTLVHIAVNKQYIGCIVISDEIKEDSAKAIRSLKALGIKKTVMLTGDAKAVGDAVGKELGIDEIHAELLPHQKVEEIEKLDTQKPSKEKLIFVGDGINDTPVLARADIGIAMGGLGSDAAIEAADVVIMTDEPSKIASAIKIAKRTRHIVWQNIVFALGIKGIFLLLGAVGVATMWEAVFSDVGVTVLAVLNAMRVLKVKHI